MTRKSFFAGLVTLVAWTAGDAAHAAERLPNLNQTAPRNVTVLSSSAGGERRFELGFDAATGNVGDGPLRVHGYRKGSNADMQVDQLISVDNGRSGQVRGVGVMSYTVHPDHRHWHFLGFARYELRRKGETTTPPRSDRKTGFCPGDRYMVRNADKLPRFVAFPEQGDQCGLGQPGLRGLFAGISVGWGDRYRAHVEGQFIDVTGLPAGDYTLVHTANPDRTLVESDYTDNSSSAAIRLTWPRGSRAKPAVTVLGVCQERAECG